MSETTPTTSELTSQYSSQVTGDLERNLKEQERLSGEIEALQAQLVTLQHDHNVLLNIQQALGVPAPEATPATAPATSVPAPRTKRASKPEPDKQGKAKKSSAPARKRTAKKKDATASAAKPGATLVELVRAHLAGQSEPRSAAEISAALGQEYPERAVKTTVVRNTLEGLVAKNQAQRTKQGSSVFYTAPDATEQAAGGEDASAQSA